MRRNSGYSASTSRRTSFSSGRMQAPSGTPVAQTAARSSASEATVGREILVFINRLRTLRSISDDLDVRQAEGHREDLRDSQEHKRSAKGGAGHAGGRFCVERHTESTLWK